MTGRSNRESYGIDNLIAVRPKNNKPPTTTPMEFCRSKFQNDNEQVNQLVHHPTRPVAASYPSAPRHALKIAKAGTSRMDRLKAKPVVQAYQDLLKHTEAMQLEATANDAKRQMDGAAYRMGLANISDELVRKQKDLIRFHVLENEVNIFQQHWIPFIFDIRSERERQINSSVYRHSNRIQAIQAMGIPIYSLDEYVLSETDRVVTARTRDTLYRRVRRRNTAHYIDNDLIPRPERKRDPIVLTSIRTT